LLLELQLRGQLRNKASERAVHPWSLRGELWLHNRGRLFLPASRFSLLGIGLLLDVLLRNGLHLRRLTFHHIARYAKSNGAAQLLAFGASPLRTLFAPLLEPLIDIRARHPHPDLMLRVHIWASLLLIQWLLG
jgi:hypothetical protein